jgi:hypothetical protein
VIRITSAIESVVAVSTEILGKPIRGVSHGRGKHSKIPETISDDDVLSGDPKRTVGWTHFGPGKDRCVVLDDVTQSPRISAAKESEVKDLKALAEAKAAISISAVAIEAASELLEKPTKVTEKRK